MNSKIFEDLRVMCLPPFITFLEATLINSVAMTFGCDLSLEAVTTGNWYSTKYVLKEIIDTLLGRHLIGSYCVTGNNIDNGR